MCSRLPPANMLQAPPTNVFQPQQKRSGLKKKKMTNANSATWAYDVAPPLPAPSTEIETDREREEETEIQTNRQTERVRQTDKVRDLRNVYFSVTKFHLFRTTSKTPSDFLTNNFTKCTLYQTAELYTLPNCWTLHFTFTKLLNY